MDWDGSRILDRASRPIQLKVKEAIHIERIPINDRLDHNGDYELPGCWIVTIMKLESGANYAGTKHTSTGALNSAPIKLTAWAQEPCL